jgi:hypothetical protein
MFSRIIIIFAVASFLSSCGYRTALTLEPKSTEIDNKADM